jgi:hypothetical protein
MTLSDMSARSRDPSLNSPNVQKAEIHKSASSLTSLCVFAYSTRHETRPRDRSRGKLEAGSVYRLNLISVLHLSFFLSLSLTHNLLQTSYRVLTHPLLSTPSTPNPTTTLTTMSGRGKGGKGESSIAIRSIPFNR